MPRLINLEKLPSRMRRPDETQLQELYGSASWSPKGPAAVRLLELVLEYRFLTREMLQLAIQEESRKKKTGAEVPHHLTKLWRFGYLKRHDRPVGKTEGSKQFVYAITEKGASRLLELALEPLAEELKHLEDPGLRRENQRKQELLKQRFRSQRFAIRNALKPKKDYEHALATVLFRLLWTYGLKYRSVGEKLDTLAYWTDREGDGSGELNQFVNTFSVRLQGERVYVNPDATIWVHDAGDRVWPLFLEIERTHKNDRRRDRRFEAYKTLLTTDEGAVQIRKAYQKLGRGLQNPGRGRVLFLGANAAHQARLYEAARSVIGQPSSRRPLEMVFGSLESLFERQVRGDLATGQETVVETIIQPRRLFTEPLGIRLKGKPWTIVA